MSEQHGVFIDVEVDEKVADDAELATKLEEKGYDWVRERHAEEVPA